MGKLIGYARVSTRTQEADRQIRELLAAGVRRDDLYTDHEVSGARASRPAFNKALEALHEGDTLVITTLDRLGRSTVNMLGLSEELRDKGINLRVLNLGGGNVDTGTPMGSMVFTVMAASTTPSPNAGPPARTWADGASSSATARSPTPAASSTPGNRPPTLPGTWACPGPPCTGGPESSTLGSG